MADDDDSSRRRPGKPVYATKPSAAARIGVPGAIRDVDAVMEVRAAAAGRIPRERRAAEVAADRARRGPAEDTAAVHRARGRRSVPLAALALGRTRPAATRARRAALRARPAGAGCAAPRARSGRSHETGMLGVLDAARSSARARLERLLGFLQLGPARLDVLAISIVARRSWSVRSRVEVVTRRSASRACWSSAMSSAICASWSP